MSGEDPANYGFPDGAPIRNIVRNPRNLTEDMLRSQQAAVAERAAAPQQMQQVIHQHGAGVQAHPMNDAEQARRDFIQALTNQMRAQQQNQQAADYAVIVDHRQPQAPQPPVYHPQAAIRNPYYQAHMQPNPQQAVQQQWFGGDDAQAINAAAQRPANQLAAQQRQLEFLQRQFEAQNAQQQAMAAQQQAAQQQAMAAVQQAQQQALRAAAAQFAQAQAPNVHVHVVAGPQQLGVDMAARDARAVHAVVQPVQFQVQMPAHNHGVFMMRAQQPPAGAPEAPEARAARIKAEREANEEADNLARRYSRACFICTNPNPLRRAVLVACGHIVCSPCAEEAKGTACHLKCPFCRKPSSFVKIFEDEAKDDEERHFEDDGDMDASESPSTNEPVQ